MPGQTWRDTGHKALMPGVRGCRHGSLGVTTGKWRPKRPRVRGEEPEARLEQRPGRRLRVRASPLPYHRLAELHELLGPAPLAAEQRRAAASARADSSARVPPMFGRVLPQLPLAESDCSGAKLCPWIAVCSSRLQRQPSTRLQRGLDSGTGGSRTSAPRRRLGGRRLGGRRLGGRRLGRSGGGGVCAARSCSGR